MKTVEPIEDCQRRTWNDLVSECVYSGTEQMPYKLSRATAIEIRDWVAPLEKQLDALPYRDQQAFVNKHRKIAKERWPWWRPGIVVELVP